MAGKGPYLLANDRYYLMGRAEADGLPVMLQCSKGQPVHYCVQYAGNGQYFDTLAEAMLYMRNRWGFDIIGKPTGGMAGRWKNPAYMGKARGGGTNAEIQAR